MPHIIAEYSKGLDQSLDFTALSRALHEGLAAEGIDVNRIKSRAIALDHASVGDQFEQGAMIHVTLLLLEGRDIPTKKQYGDALYNILSAHAPKGCAATLEVRDMAKDTYYL